MFIKLSIYLFVYPILSYPIPSIVDIVINVEMLGWLVRVYRLMIGP